MTAKEYLQQIYYLDRKIKRLQAKREAIRADLYSVRSTTNYNADRVQTSVEGDTMLRLIAKVDSIERDIVTESDRLVSLRDEISKEIEKIPMEDGQDRNVQDVLLRRYVLCQSWEQIAFELGYTVRHVYRLNGDGLQLFKKHVLECHPEKILSLP